MPSAAPASFRAGALAASLLAAQCASPASDGHSVEATYDPSTGRLRTVTMDRDTDGRIDTWTEMDGARVVRIEMDRDGDGLRDRWEYYGGDRVLQRVGFSRLNDGIVDAWAWPAADGSTARLDLSQRRDGRISRTEFYERGHLVRATEDADGDDRPEKWETYAGGRLLMVAIDSTRRGLPDRRFVYPADGSAPRVERDTDGDGQFDSVPALRAGRAARPSRPAPRE
jgi:hypothetical protein